ncbi:MAG TPA: c-type cytochrome [Terriglobia bacterium]|nr:c-type cytochrome [Terriglobia bacterium]
MKPMLSFVLTLAAVCAILATLAAAAPPEPDGAAIFTQNCQMCHGADGKGYAAIKTPDFTDKKWQASITDKQIFDVVKNGKSGTMMAAFGNKLKDDEIKAVVKRIRAFGGANGR